MTRLTPTSYAILALLAIRPWSTYELTKLLGRSVWYVMPRTEATRYVEPKRLVAAGLATAEVSAIGRRRRTTYSITPAGRTVLSGWLEQPASPTQLESEGLLKILFGNMASTSTLLMRLHEFQAEAEAVEEPWRQIALEYVDGQGPFPERLHVSTLFWVLLEGWARLRADWARWAAMEVASWPDERGPRDREGVRALLNDMLERDWGLQFPERPAQPLSSAQRGSSGSVATAGAHRRSRRRRSPTDTDG